MTIQQADMSQAQVDEFLQAPRIAVFGTVRAQGAPQLTPVWYLYENGQVFVSLSINSAKYRNLTRDPRVCICIAAPHPDARAVMIHGQAELIPEQSAWSDDIHWRITRRYYSSDDEAQEFLDSFPAEESALVSVTPAKVMAEDWN
ncbi:MAG: TIGR03618 family F420-dependent PPOX class oxidoreductase [Gammaproteobacteria bacterium]|jgi:PPOX class probable F420-dependent enzyme|nr:TIGR03618 family F420-dependent PPOX class oxidoreductase [Gammaproteobacteria bacterium]